MKSAKLLKKESLAVKDPSLAKQWHPSKNGKLTPKDVFHHSGKKVWWVCDKGHEWEAIVNNRATGTGCPYCTGIYVCNDTSFKTRKPELAKEWHPTKNGKLTPDKVTIYSARRVWWKCKKGHEWQAIIAARTNGNVCPYCNGRKLCKESSLQVTEPKLAAEWHPTKNKKLTPADVLPSSARKVFWQCKKGHEWKAGIAYRRRGRGCPYCDGKKVAKDNCLQTVNPEAAKDWHPTKNGSLTPRNVTANSQKKVWWKCSKGHEWQSFVGYRTKGYGCPYCDGRKVNKENCLATLSPELAKEWHPTKNRVLTPQTVSPFSKKRVWWKCPNGHDWKAKIFDRYNGETCRKCTRKKK
ncbi:MAG: zinc-ribbon domain-containing protein [Spirochaetales bacterium]|nr:zinc-ribbon domain-containing protein [Spirochaetales bacterium]